MDIDTSMHIGRFLMELF